MGKKLYSGEGRFSLHWECLFPEGGVEGDTLGYYNTLEQLTPCLLYTSDAADE